MFSVGVRANQGMSVSETSVFLEEPGTVWGSSVWGWSERALWSKTAGPGGGGFQGGSTDGRGGCGVALLCAGLMPQDAVQGCGALSQELPKWNGG